MNLPGKRVRRIRLVRTDRFVVAVEVEAVIPDADPSEPCYEPEVVELLRERSPGEPRRCGMVETTRQGIRSTRRCLIPSLWPAKRTAPVFYRHIGRGPWSAMAGGRVFLQSW
jgi:hypothetical protein